MTKPTHDAARAIAARSGDRPAKNFNTRQPAPGATKQVMGEPKESLASAIGADALGSRTNVRPVQDGRVPQ